MLAEPATTAQTHVLRPDRRLLRTGVIAGVALTLPVFGVAYWLTAATGTWWITAIAQVAVMAAAALVIARFRRTMVAVSPRGIVERGLLGRVNTVADEEIAALCLVELCRDDAFESQPNLFVVGAAGSVLVRLRGQYWSRDDMRAVADVLDRPLVEDDDAVTLTEMRRSRPEWLYWFERHPALSWL